MRKNCRANRVKTPCTSAPNSRRRDSSSTNMAAEPTDRIMPISENHWSGTIEKPVTRSKFRRMSRYSPYLDRPAARIPCATSISAGFAANV